MTDEPTPNAYPKTAEDKRELMLRTGNATWDNPEIFEYDATSNWRVTKPGHRLGGDKMFAHTGEGASYYIRLETHEGTVTAQLRELHTVQGRVYGAVSLELGEEAWAQIYDYMAALNEHDREDIIQLADEAAEERDRRKQNWLTTAFEEGAKAYEEDWGDDPYEKANSEAEARELIKLNWDDEEVRGTDSDEEFAEAVNGRFNPYTIFDHIEETLMG